MICNKCLMDKYIAGQAFTEWFCVECGKNDMHHNTHVPKYCKECSEKLNVCEMCGEILNEKSKEN